MPLFFAIEPGNPILNFYMQTCIRMPGKNLCIIITIINLRDQH